MKKIITYTLITILINSFSINKNAYAEKINNYNNEIVKLESNYINSFSNFSLKNDIQILNLNNTNGTFPESDFNPAFINLIIPGFTQFYYGDMTKGILFFSTTVLFFIFGPQLSTFFGNLMSGRSGGIGNWSQIGGFYVLMIIIIVSYIWGLVDANIMYSVNKKNKVSLNKTNDFDVALFNKDF